MKKWLDNQEGAIRVCMILMLVMGIIMSIMVPPWQTPDEDTHVLVIGYSLDNPSLFEVLNQDMNLESGRIRFQYEEKLNIEQWKEAVTKTPSYTRQEVLPNGMNLSVLKHLPATIGILLGTVLHLPTFWVLELGELFALLFYVAICWKAIGLMPVKKELLLMFMVFPMTMQQAASLSYDAVAIPLCFLYIAYLFWMRHTKENLGWKEVAVTLLLLLVIAYIKPPYVFLVFLVLLLPIDKIHLRIGRYEINGALIRRYRIPAVVALVLICALGIYLLRDNFWVRLEIGVIQEWKRTAYLFLATARTWWRYLIVSSVGQFGWLDSQLPFWFALLTYILVLFLAVWRREEASTYSLKGKTKWYIWIVFAILSVQTVLTMVNHTVTVTLYGRETTEIAYDIREALYSIPYIGGLQGRYFLPFLVLPFLALPVIGRRKQSNMEQKTEGFNKLWLVGVYQIIAMVLTIRVLLLRYLG